MRLTSGGSSMNAYREMPRFGTASTQTSPAKPDDDSTGCGWMLLISVIFYFAFTAFERVTSGRGSQLDQVICSGTLIFLAIMMYIGHRDKQRANEAKADEQRRWLRRCKMASLPIVNRQDAVSWWDDYNGRYQRLRNSLELEMNADQKAIAPHCTTVRVEINQFVYDRLKERDAVSIYYQPETPLTFLLSEELW
jgi:hypothetical protein